LNTRHKYINIIVHSLHPLHSSSSSTSARRYCFFSVTNFATKLHCSVLLLQSSISFFCEGLISFSIFHFIFHTFLFIYLSVQPKKKKLVLKDSQVFKLHNQSIKFFHLNRFLLGCKFLSSLLLH
jgi:hypothetical protein